MPGNLEIAVIDDDESFRIALVESLSSLGYRSSGYASAEDYLRAIGDRVFDCIVTDIHMPGMSGLDLMKRLADRGSTTPVALITARSDTNLEARAAAAGAACLLRKPFEINDLIKCIAGFSCGGQIGAGTENLFFFFFFFFFFAAKEWFSRRFTPVFFFSNTNVWTGETCVEW